MDSPPTDPVFLDTTVLSNFASSDSIGWLVEFLDEPATVPAVVTELKQGRTHGHEFLRSAIDALDDDISVCATDSDDVSVDPDQIRDRLDAGEASVLLTAIETNGTFATDDLAARRLGQKHGVRVTGSIGLLASGIRRGELDPATANDWLNTWRNERGYFAPIDRIEEVRDG